MKRGIIRALSAILLIAVVTGQSLAAVPDTRAFGRAMMKNQYTRPFAPVMFAMGDALRICAEQRTQQESGGKTEQVDRGHFAYVVSATQRLNMETDKYFAELTLINETGLFTAVTVDDVEDYSFQPVLTRERVGKMTELEGKFVQFDMRKTDRIQKLETRYSTVQTEFSARDGFYLVNVLGERSGILSFFDTSADIEDVQSASAKNCRYHEDGYAIISIDGEEYAGGFLTRISGGETSLAKGVGNAVIQMSEGKIVRVFSFME